MSDQQPVHRLCTGASKRSQPSAPVGTLTDNDRERLLAPEADLKKVDANGTELRREESEELGKVFDWNDTDAVVLPEQQQTAVYFTNGELVIRQRQWPDDDTCIFISAENIGTFIESLTDACGVLGPKPKPVPSRKR